MDPVFQSKMWKFAAISSYLGMHMGIIVITVVVPLAFICMGERDIDEIAKHSVSMKFISYWLIGVGGITCFTSIFAMIATMVKRRSFRITMTILLILNALSVVALLIWGLLPTDSRKIYFQDAWKEMDRSTKEIIQKHYSCCGFVKPEKKSLGNCYANKTSEVYWPDICYDRMTSITIPAPIVKLSNDETVTMGTENINVLLLGFLISFIFVILIQSLTTILFIIAICKNQISPDQKGTKTAAEVYENGGVTGLQNGNGNENENFSADANFAAKTNSSDVAPGVTKETKNCCSKLGNIITSRIENGFYWLGVRVAQNPKTTILLCLLIAGSLSLGLLNRKDETDGTKGFINPDHQLKINYAMHSLSFGKGYGREEYMMIVDEDNILEPNKFKAMFKIYKRIKQMNDTNTTFSDICTRVAGQCKETNLFELWNHNETVINSLTTEDILEKLNNNRTSLVFGHELDIGRILGGITRTPDGKISRAKAHLMTYYNRAKDIDWEIQFIKVGNEEYENISTYVNARESSKLEVSQYESELPLLFGGFCLIFIYIILMTGKFSLLQHRAYIALMGVATTGLAMAAGIGLSASLGFKWNIIHMVSPFLIIGIGVDDMFIILQAWNTVDDDPELKDKSLPERAGFALKRAGASITITSVTDLIAFAVGASSEIVTFSSFSIYVAVSIILLFALQCTFFLACTVLDQRRREERYDACLACCYKHDESYKPTKCSEREWFQTFFEDGLGRVVQYLPVQIIAIIITIGITSVMIWGFTLLKVGHDNKWYLPIDSYLLDFNDRLDKYFPGGQISEVVVVGVDFYKEREKLHLLYERLKENENINPKYLTSWFEHYASWMASEKNITNLYAEDSYKNEWQFYVTINEFLKGRGKVYSDDLILHPAGLILASKFPIRHRSVENGIEDMYIMDSIQADCDAVDFIKWKLLNLGGNNLPDEYKIYQSTKAAFPYHRSYFVLEVMRIIQREVYRNLGITLLCVFIVVLPMIGSIQMSFWVALCVLFTTIDVAGSMYFAGIYIETSSIITLLISIGLAIDYAAHVAHKFLTLKGTRKMRVRVTLGQIGPAVFNGGFSTFLALVLLAGSNTYAYRVFFTVFVCVVVFGLWNGLVFLPCVLGLFGPDPHETAREARLSQRHYERKKKREMKDLNEDQTTTM